MAFTEWHLVVYAYYRVPVSTAALYVSAYVEPFSFDGFKDASMLVNLFFDPIIDFHEYSHVPCGQN